MTRTAYMTAAAAAITESTGLSISAEQAEQVLGPCWDAAQAEAKDAAQFSAVMRSACTSFARSLRDMSWAA